MSASIADNNDKQPTLPPDNEVADAISQISATPHCFVPPQQSWGGLDGARHVTISFHPHLEGSRRESEFN